MTDLPAMDPCPAHPRGRHDLGAILPEDRTGDMTLYCERCGAVRRLPAQGALLADRMDDMDASEIERRILGLR